MLTYVDFETSSEIDLIKCGAARYSEDESTEILCAVFIKEDGSEKIWKKGDPVPQANPNNIYVAHNAFFEQTMWRNVWGNCPPKWKCTAAKGCAHALPASLEKLAEALNLLQVKDMEGCRHMLKMCKPNGPRDEKSILRLIKYCRQDVLTTIGIDKALPDLSPEEQEVWELDQEINFRGVGIDFELVQNLKGLLEYEKERLESEFQTLVSGKVVSPRASVALRAWISESLGMELDSVDKKTLSNLGNLPEDVNKVVSIRKILSKSSTAKLQKMLGSLGRDGRIRENLLYHGASTGRWTGRGVQLQNLPRPKIDAEEALETLDIADVVWPEKYGSITETASSLLRSCLVPKKGKVFIGGDYAGIEARILPWIARDEKALDIFRENRDVYCESASTIYGRAITKEDKTERQVGKCAVLGLGYQGGIAAFKKMCDIYAVSLEPVSNYILDSATAQEKDSASFVYGGYRREAEKNQTEFLNETEGMTADIIKQRWRKANMRIVAFWDNIQNQMERAIQGTLSGSSFYPNLSLGLRNQFLSIVLPSGRHMKYFQPRVEMKVNKFGIEKRSISYAAVDPITKQLSREYTYGGKITENIVQAIARDIMVEGMKNVKNHGGELVLTVHDELLCEYEEGARRTYEERVADLEEVRQCFLKMPSWAKGLPLDAECWTGMRYQK